MGDEKSIAGKWMGRFDCTGGLGPMWFEAAFTDDAGHVPVAISEPNVFAPIAAQVLQMVAWRRTAEAIEA